MIWAAAGTIAAYFNPRSPCGERRSGAAAAVHLRYFNPRSPCGERRAARRKKTRKPYFNPRSPCGERLARNHGQRALRGISIHAPRAGSDVCQIYDPIEHIISIHAPRAGSDSRAETIATSRAEFQSTLPVRGATLPHRPQNASAGDFNPRSPCGERRFEIGYLQRLH